MYARVIRVAMLIVACNDKSSYVSSFGISYETANKAHATKMKKTEENLILPAGGFVLIVGGIGRMPLLTLSIAMNYDKTTRSHKQASTSDGARMRTS